jgi:hypothetical protein
VKSASKHPIALDVLICVLLMRLLAVQVALPDPWPVLATSDWQATAPADTTRLTEKSTLPDNRSAEGFLIGSKGVRIMRKEAGRFLVNWRTIHARRTA